MPTPPHLKFAVLAVDAVCFTIRNNELYVFLGKVNSDSIYKNRWAHIGGLIQPKETADEAIERLLKDKAGIKKIFKEQLYTFSEIDRDPRGRVVSVAYLALINWDDYKEDPGEVETRWVPFSAIPSLAYDHDEMTTIALERLKSKIAYTNIAQHLLPKEFTLTELQKIYEIVLNKKCDKRNFRKKILASHMLKDMKKVKKQGVMRPAQLYSFASTKQELFEI
jgi:8-oxo-dGTP diphosphatase